MDVLTDQQAKAAYHLAAFSLSTKWFQQGLKRTVEEWKTNRQHDYELLLTAVDGCGAHKGLPFLETQEIPDGTGQYGYFTEFYLKPDVGTNILPEDQPEYTTAMEFSEDWVSKIVSAIRDDQQSSLLSPKEFVTHVGVSNPENGERRVADALGVTVGTVRGKKGRIKNKLSTARNTVELEERIESLSETGKTSHQTKVGIIEHIDEDALPADALKHTYQDTGHHKYIIEPVEGESYTITIE